MVDYLEQFKKAFGLKKEDIPEVDFPNIHTMTPPKGWARIGVSGTAILPIDEIANAPDSPACEKCESQTVLYDIGIPVYDPNTAERIETNEKKYYWECVNCRHITLMPYGNNG